MLVKFLQCLVMVALANPFCCCTAELLAPAQVTAGEAHGCCTSEVPEPGSMPRSDSDHKPGECPHQLTRDHQQSGQQDVQAVQAVTDFVPLLLARIEFQSANLSGGRVLPLGEVKAPKGSPPSFSQLYCVYRI